jgi:hypothetical protein
LGAGEPIHLSYLTCSYANRSCGAEVHNGKRQADRRMEGADSKPVKALSANLEAVLTALRHAGVELPDENTIRQ